MSFRFARASNAAAATRLKGTNEAAMFIAGGSCVVDLLSQNVLRPSLLIDLNGLPDRDIEVTAEGGLRVGALATMGQLAWHSAVMSRYPVLMQALLSGATPQVHHAATIGGNLLQKTRCSYYRNAGFDCNKRKVGSGCSAREGFNAGHAIFGASENCIAVHPSDLGVGLLALDATVTLRSVVGTRTLPISELHRLPGDTPHIESALATDELIVRIDIPTLADGARSAYNKVDEHNSYSFAVVSVAAVLATDFGNVSHVRLAAGGVAPKPWRLVEAEAALLGRPMNKDSIQQASAAAFTGAVPLKHNAHKVQLLERTVFQTLTQLADTQ